MKIPQYKLFEHCISECDRVWPSAILLEGFEGLAMSMTRVRCV